MSWFSSLKRKISNSLLGKRQWQITLIALVAMAVILWLYRFDRIGFGGGESVTTTITKRDANGNVIETVATTPESGKTLWDWLGLLGVPLTLAGLGYFLQQEQQKQANEEASEEVLQSYFDRLSTLLIDKNLLAIAVKVHGTEAGERGGTSDEQELLDAAVDIIRARTLSILRRFENDGQRKGSVIRFLSEAKVLSKTNLSLSVANLNSAHLSGADLSGTDLRAVRLMATYLITADLSGADLSGADLSGADLSYANLSYANLSYANFSGANLSSTILIKCNVAKASELTQEQLSQARICNIVLPDGMDLDPNRDCDELKKMRPELFP